MSKILWKYLLVTPAVFLATLLMSAGTVRATRSEANIAAETQATIAAETQATNIVVPHQTSHKTVEAQLPEAQLAATPAAPTQVLYAEPVAPTAETVETPTPAAVAPAAETLETPAPAAEAAQTATLAAVPGAPASSNAPVFSTNSAAALQSSTNVDVKLPDQVAVSTSKQQVVEPEAVPTVEMSEGESVSAMPEANPTKVAQTTPASDDTRILRQINRYGREGRAKGEDDDSLDQVTNVSQFRDVRPGDWAYEALRELVERYGCIAGYPDSTYRGNRALTRYEFAAGLRACLNQVEKLIAASTADFATKEDLEKLRRLTQEFQAELATLGTRVDRLEGRVGFLESRQFSTTTKLVGEAILAVTTPVRRRNNTEDRNTTFGDRVRLDFQTSFTGRDVLHTRLATGNLRALDLGNSNRSINNGGNAQFGSTFEGNQTFNITGNTNNSVILDWLAYEFPFGQSKVYVAATGGIHADYAPVLNPYFYDGDGGNGSLSTLAQQSPIYRIGGGAGAAIRFGVGNTPIIGPTSITLGYLADNANRPDRPFGLTSGDYAALGQVNFNISDRFALGATYVNGYHTSGNGIYDIGGSAGQNNGFPIVGSSLANNPALLAGATAITNPSSTSASGRLGRMVTNSYGVEAAFRLSDNISISGYGMRTNVRVLGRGDGQIWSYGGGVALPDFGKKGSVLGLFAGMEPTLRGFRFNQAGTRRSFSRDTSYHFEGFYKYQLSDNISITPGVIWITAPNQDKRNNNSIIGTLRTTFTF